MKIATFLGALAILASTSTRAQGPVDWNTAGNFGLNPLSSFLGTTNGVPINFRTNNVLRMRLLESLPSQTIGSYTNENLSGNVGIGAFGNSIVDRPFSLLHLDNGGTQYSGYRPWFRPGMTITNSTDLGWIGLKNEGGDINHLTLAWADNNMTDGPDLFKIIFLANPTTSGTAGTIDGLETMRILPATTGIESFVGIGDWFTAGLNPTDRLDLLNGSLRIRDLPGSAAANTLNKIMVVDNTGLVKWRDASTLGGGGACSSGWNLLGNGNIVTAFNGNPCPPQSADYVGIGTSNPTSKLTVQADLVPQGGSYTAVDVRNYIPTVNELGSDYIGVYARTVDLALPPSSNSTMHYGGKFEALNATKGNIGVYGKASNSTGFFTPTFTGVKGESVTVDGSTGIGVYGINTGRGYAGQFDGAGGSSGILVNGTSFINGDLHISGAGWVNGSNVIISDENLKQDISPLQNALETISQLQPKTYNYNTAEYGYLGLPDGQHMGLLAQDAEGVLPSIVHSTVWPEVRDTSGTVIHPELPVKGIDYTSLIPLLIAGMQEQQATIAQLQDQITQCCAAQGGGMAPQGEDNTKSTPQDESNLHEQRLLVQPNPFTDHTTLRYYVPKSGKVSLQVSGSDGRTFGTLREEQADAGDYSYEWNTTQLAPGTYLCALLVDGNVVVKRAVKVAR